MLNMAIIHSKEEFEDIYPYDNVKRYPIRYPCVCKIESQHSEVSIYVAYPPIKGTILNAFFLGLTNPWSKL